MAGYRIPGPICTTKNPCSIDDGTLNLGLTAPPGPICADSFLYPSRAMQCLQEKMSPESDLSFLFRQFDNPKRGSGKEDYGAAVTQSKVETAAIKAVADVKTTGNVQVYSIVGHAWVTIDTSDGPKSFGFAPARTIYEVNVITTPFFGGYIAGPPGFIIGAAIPTLGRITEEHHPPEEGEALWDAVPITKQNADILATALQRMNTDIDIYPYSFVAYNCYTFAFQVRGFAAHIGHQGSKFDWSF